MDREAYVDLYLEIALAQVKEKKFFLASENYTSALFNILSIATTNCKNEASGVSFMLEKNTSAIYEQTSHLYSILVKEIQSSIRQPSVMGGNFHFCVLVHMGWLLRRFEEARQFVEYACNPQFCSTTFLSEYAKALFALANKAPYQPLEMRVRGLEKYWWEYLKLISDLTNFKDSSGSIESVKISFVRKNKDYRLDDNYDIEGTKKHPVKWDFRLASILEYASEFYGIPK